MESDYSKYRGKCKEFSEKLVLKNPSLRLVRGWYHCPFWGQQGHWWCEDSHGNIVDPTKLQFPSKGNGTYEEFNGILTCDQCGKEFPEEEECSGSNYPVCSTQCYMSMVL